MNNLSGVFMMTKDKKSHIFITNDDGARSPALRALIKALHPHYKLSVVIPSQPRSGISKAISFDVPLRFWKGAPIEGQEIIETTGTPADTITWCRTYTPDIDLVITGPNLGLNVSLHSIFTSGTVGGAFEAALWEIPAIAFSIETPSHTWFLPGESNANMKEATYRAQSIIAYVLKEGFPTGVDFLNVSFPSGLDEKTPTTIAKSARVRFINRLVSRVDTHGLEYHWIEGEPKRQIPRSSDVYASTNDLHVVITPININVTNDPLVEVTKKFLNPLLEKKL